jgi:murein L,D-transpeptidase YcbB/YkuD
MMVLGTPSSAATPEELAAARPSVMFGNPAVDAFYSARNGAPLWLADGPDSEAAHELIQILRRSSIEGYADGPAIASQAEALLARAETGDPSSLPEADRLLSTGWVNYVAMLRRPPAGMIYAEQWIAPHAETSRDILLIAAAARSLPDYLRSVSEVNPLYAELRDTAWSELQSSGTQPDPRLLASLERVRILPAKGKYVLVDAAGARLSMIEDGRVVDSMKVIVGKSTSQTPMVASAIHYATLNPYWNVPPDLVQKMIAHNVLSQGSGYLKGHGYQLLSDFGDDPQVVLPEDVDWKAVADGSATVRVRQLPGPGNSMGHLKFGFANNSGIYLHDTPKKELFAGDSRDLSNGCIRLEDAGRLGRWLLGREPSTASSDPEQQVLLPKPVPVYVTYLTAHAEDGQLTLLSDIYGRDAPPTMAALR